jgi:hypothetical protein
MYFVFLQVQFHRPRNHCNTVSLLCFLVPVFLLLSLFIFIDSLVPPPSLCLNVVAVYCNSAFSLFLSFYAQNDTFQNSS